HPPLPQRPPCRRRPASSWCTARATAGGAGTRWPPSSAPRGTASTRRTSRHAAPTRALRDLPDGERAVLVGHSFGGMSIALAAEEFPDKVAAAVFLTAFMPDCD
uniref:AB hydrolase-1 domain-containing protein n=1 Tax=Aegilops tauschii subsp. strangulata TaxID=200361 RepID=A0A453CX27_AEGTS